jgi:amidohydrolase
MNHLTRVVALVLPVLSLLPPAGVKLALAETPQQWVEKHLAEVVAVYQHFHRNPELSLDEQQTAARLAAELKSLGAEVTTGVGGQGVVALLRNGSGPTLMLRTDLDALPVAEQTGLPYASKVRVQGPEGTEVGVMHACGHDIHIANLIGVARYMAANKDQWQGTLMLIGQPAEEIGAGAKAMLEDGLFERFGKPDFALALHVDAALAVGKVGHRAGYALANVDSIDITVRGRGGHGAFPHTTVSREIAPIEPAVITVGSIRGGTKHNVIGDDCHLQLTVRSYSDEVRAHLLEAIERKAKAVAQSFKAPEPTIKITQGTPALFNSEELVGRVVPVFEKLLGRDNVVASEPSMGGEDFGRYGRAGVPIFMYRLGSVDARRLDSYLQRGLMPPSLHSPRYYPDAEATLATGIVTMTTAALDLLKK